MTKEHLMACGVPEHAVMQAEAAGVSLAFVDWLRTHAVALFTAAVQVGPAGWTLVWQIERAILTQDWATALTAAAQLFALLHAPRA